AERDMIADSHMSCERHAVGEHIFRSDCAIVRDVRLGHKQVVVAHRGQRAATSRAAVHRHAFADDVASSDHEARLLAFELQVRWRLADRGEGIDSCALADLARAFDDYVSGDLHVIVNSDAIADDRIWADCDICAESRALIDNCCWMNHTDNREWGMGSGECGHYPHSPLPIPTT